MNVYLYYSKNKIPDIQQPELFKRNLQDAAGKIFIRQAGTAEHVSVQLQCAKISKNIDIYVILDAEIDIDIQKKMELLKQEILKIMQYDQKSEISYSIQAKSDPNYKPAWKAQAVISSADMEKTAADREAGMEEASELDYEKRSKMYVPSEPAYTFDRVILPEMVLEKIEEALNIVQYEEKVFREWGLYAIQPHPSSALSFYGESGTGKTMAAEAIAEKLHKKILKVSYADIESKFHGEGPKMVKAIFLAAQNEDAVLFIDEADSLLSKRLTNVTQGSEQAINSMRSQLLICLEEFHGIVIFATNLVVNYDQAFLTRLISVEFTRPDLECRRKIWEVHIRPTNGNALRIPLAEDVNTGELAEKYDFCGREIRKAVISACVNAAMREADQVCQADFLNACEKVKSEEHALASAKDHTLSNKAADQRQKQDLKEEFQKIIQNAEKVNLDKNT